MANGDFGTAATAPCPTAANPFVKADGSCGKCTANAECAGASHGGVICNTLAGSCGGVCAVDGDCATGSFCDLAAATHVCTPKKADGAACTAANQRTAAQCNGNTCGPAAIPDAGADSGGTDAGGTDAGSSGSVLAAMVGLALRTRRRRDD